MSKPEPPPFQDGNADVLSKQLEVIRRTMIEMVQESRRQHEESLRCLKKIAWNTFWVALVVFILPVIFFVFWVLLGFAAVAVAG